MTAAIRDVTDRTLIERTLQDKNVELENASPRPFGGGGLGLHLSRRLADVLDAEILVKTAAGSGSRLTLVLHERPR